MYHNNAKTKQVFDFTEKPVDDFLEEMRETINDIKLLVMQAQGMG